MKTCASPNPWPIEDSLVFKTWHGRISTASRMDSPQVPRQLLRVGNPNDSDCFLVIKTIRYGRTWSVRGMPGAVIERGAHGAITGYLQVPIWISSSNPVPCVLEPPAAMFSALVGKPCDFVVSPHPVTPPCRLVRVSCWRPSYQAQRDRAGVRNSIRSESLRPCFCRRLHQCDRPSTPLLQACPESP